MTCNVGSASTVLVVWALAGLLALAGTLVYSELAAMLPVAGADYLFLRRGYGRLVGFLYGWMALLVARPAGQAALAVGLAIFLNVALGGVLSSEQWSLRVGEHALHFSALTGIALGAIWLVALINCGSVARGGLTALVLTWAKVALVLLIAGAAFMFGHGDFAHFAEAGSAGSCEGVAVTARGGIAGFGAAMLGALWAYNGWSNVTPLLGEIKDPKRNVPRAFIGGTLVVAALYLLVNTAYFYVLRPVEIASISATSSVATEVLRRFVGPLAVGLTAAAMMLSSFGALQASALAGSRIPFAMARDGMFFRGLDTLSANRVPVRAILLQALIASLYALAGSYDTLTDSVVFAAWLFYGLTAASLFIFRRREPEALRPYRTWGYPWIPGIFVMMAAALLINTFIATPHQALGGVAVLIAGVPFYAFWSSRRKREQ